MPDFRRAPDWDQAANRDSQITDPVLTVRQISRFDPMAGRGMTAHADRALVFTTPDGGLFTYRPPLRPSRAEAASRNYRGVYEVDTGIHHLQLTEPLPSQGDAFTFTALVDVTWQVLDPEQVVRSGVRDVPRLIGPRIQQTMRAASRRHSVEHSETAELAVQQAVTDVEFGAAEGLRVTVVVRLDLDAAAREQQSRLRGIRYDTDALTPTFERERLRTTQEQQLLAQKAEFYQWHLARGGSAQWAVQLAQHPEDLRVVVEALRGEESSLLRHRLDVVTKLLEQRHLEGYQLEETGRLALEQLQALFAPPQPTPPAPPAPEDQPPAYPTLPAEDGLSWPG
ncbi:hypothetical protein [Streptacidiphilus jiangxiensis]|uniref:SPFH domain / Band 7 family protein n=1 Tax=Streptacidiphilus jiangxiensis TaxID=235985 RepID=A0A1H7M5Q8_STRJI|nr:hypothetical protein [Streptacidiphilus jiangxiensis]SEL05917.1 hypothetical protein SAMN05414137_105165 [Streptacidiphilus jiangxiensis]